MDKLSKCIKIYEQLLHKDFFLTLENGFILNIYFLPENFVHLTGLHKLTDLKQLIPSKTNPARRIYRNIKCGKITYQDIIRSSKFQKINDRLEAFPLLPTVFNKKVVVDFNPALVERTKIKSEFILYNSHKGGYIHLGVCAGMRNGHFPETFLYEPSNYYLSEQTLLEVTDVQTIDYKNKKA